MLLALLPLVLVAIAFPDRDPLPEATTATTATTTTSTTSTLPAMVSRERVIEEAGPRTPDAELTRRGNLTIDEPGEVVEGVWVDGVVDITAEADGARLSDCVVRGARRTLVVHVHSGATDVTIERCRLHATAPSEGVVGSFGGAPRMTVRHNEISGQADGIKADSYSTYDANVIRSWKASGSSVHLDGLQASGRRDVTARRNVIESTIGDGLNFGLYAESYAGGACRQMGTIDFSGNWVDGGNRGVVAYFMGHEGCPTRSYAESVRVTGNTFGSASEFRYSYYHSSANAPAGVVTVSGNRTADGRALTGAFSPR